MVLLAVLDFAIYNILSKPLGSISLGGAVHGLAWLQSSTCINLLATFYHFFLFLFWQAN